MWKGLYGISSNVSCPNFAVRPKTKKQRLEKKTLSN